MKMNKNAILAAIALLSTMTGCRHGMEVTNLSKYDAETMPSLLKKELTVLLSCPNNSELSSRVAMRLRDFGGYNVYTDIFQGAEKSDMRIEVLSENAEGTADWTNFFVCMPGCLLFTHAWLGYGYRYDMKWRIRATDLNTDQLVFDRPVDVSLEFRYARPGTTWGNVTGVCLLGIIWPVINGVIVESYDDKATPELMEKVKEALAKHFAFEILKNVDSAMNAANR